MPGNFLKITYKNTSDESLKIKTKPRKRSGINKQTNNLTMSKLMCTDYNLLQVEDIVEIHQYPTTTNGYAVWETEWMSNYDENDKFNRYRSYGPFAELAELLECLGLLDNKIAIKYKSGLFIGFYDGQIRVGNRCTHLSSTHYIKSSDEILERYNSYVNRCKELNQRRKF